VAEETQSQVQLFLDERRAERDQVENELREISMLTQQVTVEVDKLARRNAEIANRIRQMESSFQTVHRDDIKNIYSTAQKEQGRLYMMRGQLEKLQANGENLRKYLDLLTNAIDLLGQFEQGGAGRDSDVLTARSMVVRIFEAQERERQSLSRRMHDGPAQQLTNVILRAEICQRLLDTDQERARVELENLKEEVNKAFQRTRTFIADLRPMMLDDLGLVPTLRRYTKTWGEEQGIQTEFTLSGSEHRVAPLVEVAVFRSIQGLMKNAAQHANPSRVQVSLQLDGQTVQATVEDDGIGFDVDEVMAAADARKAIGIASIIDRVQMLGGTIDFESVLGRGTKVTMRLPEA
jgi:two-component system sensor histidine kinase DegS